jgi:beta-1,2-mannobiose phosphorylase / 1,2-beta-oligomannan phosphorylase
MLNWYDERDLASQEYWWENQKIGPCAEPVETRVGWLMLYHGVYLGDDVHIRTYRVGAMLLDLADPYKVIARTPEPIMEPEAEYEKFGNHDNVISPCANPVIDGTLHIYYGAADTCIGLATVDVDELLEHLLQHRV